MDLEDVLSVGKKWRTSGLGGKIIIIAFLLGLILGGFILLDQSYSIISKWNITGKISTFFGDRAMDMYYFDALLILSAFVVIFLSISVVALVLVWSEIHIRKEVDKRAIASRTLMDGAMKRDREQSDDQNSKIIDICKKSGNIAMLNEVERILGKRV
jgi:hypothetical protein